MKLNAVLAAATAALLLSAAPASAVPITYTLSGLFSGTLDGNAFSNYAATFTGIGDTATRTFKQDANFVTLTSLQAVGDLDGAVYTLTDSYEFFSAPTPFSTAGFKTVGGLDKLAFAGPALATYDNNSSLATSPVVQYFSAPFATDKGIADVTGTGLTFSATVAAVPEPATWAMMIGGFGMIGASLRRRSTVRIVVSFA